MKLRSIILIVLTGILLFFCADIFAYESVTVVVQDVKVNCDSIRIDSSAKQVILIKGKNKSPALMKDIQYIYDKDGVDISQTVLGKYYLGKPDLSNSGQSSTPRNSNMRTFKKRSWFGKRDHKPKIREKQLWKIGFGLSTNMCTVAGDHYRNYKQSQGYDFYAYYAPASQLALIATASKQGLTKNDGAQTYIYAPGGSTAHVTDSKYWVNQYTVGARIISYYSKSRELDYWYMQLKAGSTVNYYDIKGYFLYYPNRREEFTRHKSDSRFVTSLGFGLTIGFYEHLGMDIGADCNVVILGNSNGEGGGSASIIDYHLGLAYQF